MRDGELEGRWALVTGASSGMGVDFARELAARGASLVLVARRAEKLEELASELEGASGTRVEVVPMDLGTRSAPQELYDLLEEKGIAVDLLINNAGFGAYGPFVEQSWERVQAMLDLDIATLAHLTKLFVDGMVERRWGRILQVASIAAYQPSPTYAAYCGAKSFVLLFGESLNFELRGTGVSCTVISPGVTATEFFDVAGQKPALYHRLFMMESAKVARIGVRAMIRGRSSVVPGFGNTMNAWLTRFAPRRLNAYVANLLMTRG